MKCTRRHCPWCFRSFYPGSALAHRHASGAYNCGEVSQRKRGRGQPRVRARASRPEGSTTPSDEFDDVERHGPFVSSGKARAEMARIAQGHGLVFEHNPGGGEFAGAGFRCQITACDDIADLAKLREALAGRSRPQGEQA